MPTLLQAAGQPVPGWCEGRILPPFGTELDAGERAIFAVEARSNSMRAPLTRATVAMIKGQHKLIRYLGHPQYEREYELYNLAEDPEELEDLYPSAGAMAVELQQELDAKLREVDQPWID
jgi:arylsulfatase A-like enzyme